MHKILYITWIFSERVRSQKAIPIQLIISHGIVCTRIILKNDILSQTEANSQRNTLNNVKYLIYFSINSDQNWYMYKYTYV